MTRKLIKILVPIMLLVYTQVNAGGWPKLPLPKNVKVTTVGEELLVNGMPMRVLLFTSGQSNTEVASFYMNLWESTNVSENRFGSWYQISHLDKNYFITIQLKPGAGKGTTARAVITRTDGKSKLSVLQNRIPKMRGTMVLSDVASKDVGSRGRTLMMSNSFSVTSNVDYYRDHYRQNGWRTMMDQGTNRSDGGHALVFTKSGTEIAVVASRENGKTNIIFNESRKGR